MTFSFGWARDASADPGQGIADEHVNDPTTTERGPQDDDPGRVSHHLADERRLPPERVGPQHGYGGLGLFLRDHGDELALVGHVERVDAEQVAGAEDLGGDRQQPLFEDDP